MSSNGANEAYLTSCLIDLTNHFHHGSSWRVFFLAQYSVPVSQGSDHAELMCNRFFVASHCSRGAAFLFFNAVLEANACQASFGSF